ncbi:MAG: AAA family ATPase [Candidatus Limnocylindria bacterium]
MRIEEIVIHGFGRFHEARWLPAAGLTVIRGDNEAGKSTLLAFIRAMLFGFETDRYPALEGGRRGGWLGVRTAEGRTFRIERHSDRGGTGKLEILDDAGVDRGAVFLPRLLQGVEATLYRNVFAFGLEELSEFKRLADGEVASRIYGAGLGTGAASALDVEAELRDRQSRIFLPSGERPRLNVLLRELDELERRLAALDLPAEYASKRRRLRELEAAVAVCENELGALESQQAADERLIAGWTAWVQLRAAADELAALGAAPAMPPDPLVRHGELAERLRNAEAARAASADRLARLDERAASLDVDDALLARAADIEEIVDVRRADRARRLDIERVEREVEVARARADESIARLGADWDPERVLGFDDSVSVRSAVGGRFRSMLETAQREAQRAEDEAAAEAREVERGERRSADLAALLEALAAPDARASVEETEAALRRLDRELAQVAALRSVDALVASGSTPQGADRVITAAGAGVLGGALGAAIALVAGVGPLPAVLVAASAAVSAAAAWLFIRARRGVSPSPTVGGAPRPTDERIIAAETAIGETLRRVGLPDTAPDAAVGALRRSVDEARAAAARRVALEEQHAAEVRSVESLRARAQAAARHAIDRKRAESEIVAGWTAWLREHGLRVDLDRESAAALIDAVATARDRLIALAELQARLADLEAERVRRAERGTLLLADLGRPPASAADLGSAIDALATDFAVASDAAAETARLGRDRAELVEMLAAAEAERSTAAADLASFLESCGVADEDGLRTSVALADRRTALQAEIDAAHLTLAALSGPGDVLAAFERALATVTDIADNERRVRERGGAIRLLTAERDDDLQEIGALKDAISAMEASVEASEDRQRRADLLAQIQSEADEWATLALAGALLRKTRDRFEREHRPAVLASAERYLGAWTGGRWVRISAPMGKQVEALERSDGARVPLAGLSRGTAEQLYLALRFALVERFAAEAEPLPIVMDEILVNFDDGRARAAARSIEELSRTHQVLYFTCAPSTPLAADLELRLEPSRLRADAEPVGERTTVLA